MKKSFLFVAVATIFTFSGVASAGYVTHQFIDADVEQNDCIEAGKKAIQSAGFEPRLDGQTVYGMNDEGYTIQYMCVTRKGASYLMVNGFNRKINSDIRKNFYEAIKNEFLTIKESYK